MSNEREALKAMRNASPYSVKCPKCQVVKHKSKFRRYNSHYQTCNECFLAKGKKDV